MTVSRASGRENESVARVVAEDPHRVGSVDHRLLDSQVPLSAATREVLYRAPDRGAALPISRRPYLEEMIAALTADAVHDFQRATALRRWVAAIPRTFPEGGKSTHDRFWGDYRTFLCGGTEEELIKKGTPLAAELSRVLVTLAHLSGLHARLVFLYAGPPEVNRAPASALMPLSSGLPERHTVTEIFVSGRWSVFDPVSDRSYAWPKHGYASVWELRTMPQLIDGLQDHGRLPYVSSRFYQTVGIAAYDLADRSWAFPWDPLDSATAARLLAGKAA